MGYGVDISNKNNHLPLPDFSVSSYSHCQGNIIYMVEKINLMENCLSDYSQGDWIFVLKDLIAEIDKENDGKFDDEYWYECDKSWSKLREFNQHAEDVRGYMEVMKKTPKEAYGIHRRQETRKQAMDFMLFTIAGYEITLTP